MSKLTLADLDKKTPEELKVLLTTVKVGELDFEDKKKWVDAIEERLGNSPKNHAREIEILKKIQEGAADLDDYGVKIRDY